MESAYIFLYSELEKDFDCKLLKACQHYNALELRARYNSHRKLKIYSVLATEKNAELINRLIDKDRDAAWKILKDKSLEINNGSN